jgi:hypothetical protein
MSGLELLYDDEIPHVGIPEYHLISGIVGLRHLVSTDDRIPRKQIILCSDVHVDMTENACMLSAGAAALRSHKEKPLSLKSIEPYLKGEITRCIDKKCVYYFPVVLQNLIRETKRDLDEKVDLYIELDIEENERSRITEAKQQRKLTLMSTWLFFKDCYSRQKEKCQKRWPNLRYHYADYRVDSREQIGYNPFVDIIKVMKRLENEMEYLLYEVRMESGDNIFSSSLQRQILDSFKFQGGNTLKEKLNSLPRNASQMNDYISKVIQDRRIQHQLVHVKIPGFQAMLEDFLRKEVIELFEKYDYEKQLADLKNRLDILSSERLFTLVTDTNSFQYILLFLNDLLNLMIQASPSIMDAYTLARMFKSFGGNEDQNNVVVYAGAYHIGVYHRFLTTYFSFYEKENVQNPIEEDQKKTNSCLETKQKLSFKRV